MKALIQKDTCNQMVTVALLTTDKTWKQPIRGVDKEDVVHMCDGICHKEE